MKSTLPTVLGDDVLDELVVRGRYDELPAILESRFGPVADGIVLRSNGTAG